MQQISDVNRGDKGVMGPTPSDMIPALRGLSSLQVSFGSASDVVMTPGDTILGKRGACDEEEVEGQRLDLSLGLDYGKGSSRAIPKKGRNKATMKEPSGPIRERGEQENRWFLQDTCFLEKRRGHMCGLAKRNELHIVQLSGSWE
jgi:hypothetical protein